MNNLILGFDNGCTGSIGILNCDENFNLIDYDFKLTPFIKSINYQKPTIKRGKEYYNTLSRLNYEELKEIIKPLIVDKKVIIYMERPLNNPKNYVATLTAFRCLEATLIVLEQLGLIDNTFHNYIDSKEWQHKLLSNVKGRENLKKESLKLSLQLFPFCRDLLLKHKDGDGLLIAEYIREKLYLLK